MHWWVWMIFAILGAPLTLVLHELSHAVVVWIKGGTVTSFKPWPDFSRPIGKLGYVSYELPDDPIKYPSIYLSPFLKSCSILVVWCVLGLLVFLPMLALSAWELIDAGNWLRQFIFYPDADYDGSRWRRYLRSK